ncbi:MAG: diguanylate cyclase domain-containing protein [Terracidiphilus sp.]
MNLRQIAAWGAPEPSDGKAVRIPDAERFLTLIAEGAALGMPEVDSQLYQEFRDGVAKLARQLPDHLPDEEKLALIRTLLRQFEEYRYQTEAELRSRTTEWRSLVSFLFSELLNSLGIDSSTANAERLKQKMAGVTAAASIEDYRRQMESFLHPAGAGSAPVEASQLHAADHTTANDNAAGLRGGGSAIEHLRGILASGGKGFIVLFRLTCLNMISQRFGPEAVEDCLMAVAAFLTQSLHSDDAIFHWSDSSLLAILQGRANEQILTAELERIIMQNRETSVNIGGRSTMLRIPIAFDLTPTERLSSAEDLRKITLLTAPGGKR